jgi:hypothetical protein
MRVTNWLYHGLFLALLATVLIVAGCRDRVLSRSSTDTVYAAVELDSGMKGDSHYAQVNREWLPVYWAEWRDELHRKHSVVQWDSRFDCNHFAVKFVADANVTFYLSNFHSRTQAQSLALAVVYYLPSGAVGAHALVQAHTQHGREFFEPQTGQFVQLSTDEVKSVFFRNY